MWKLTERERNDQFYFNPYVITTHTLFQLLLFGHQVVSDSLRPHELKYIRLPGPSLSLSLLKLMSIESVIPSNHLIICRPLLLLPSIFASIRVFSSESILCIRWPKYWSLTSPSVLPMNTQGWYSLGLTGLVSLLSKGLSRVFSIPQFKNINSLALSFLYGPTLTSIHDYWKNHSFD